MTKPTLTQSLRLAAESDALIENAMPVPNEIKDYKVRAWRTEIRGIEPERTRNNKLETR